MDTPQTITPPDIHRFRLSHIAGSAHAKTGPTPGASAGSHSVDCVGIDAVAASLSVSEFCAT